MGSGTLPAAAPVHPLVLHPRTDRRTVLVFSAVPPGVDPEVTRRVDRLRAAGFEARTVAPPAAARRWSGRGRCRAGAEAAGGTVAGTRIAAMGLTFKAGTDDMRESPAVEIITRLVALGADVHAYDPAVTTADLPGVTVEPDPYAAIEGATVLAVLTEWDEFTWLDLDKAAHTMAARHVVDARNILDIGALRRRGFTYRGIGRA